MPKYNIFAAKFTDIYPLYIQKVERKNRTKGEVNQIIYWLTGYESQLFTDQRGCMWDQGGGI